MKKIIQMITVLGLSVITGMLLLCLAYTLPTDVMKSHVSRNIWLLSSEGDYPVMWGWKSRDDLSGIKRFLFNTRGMMRDNYTDAIMLANAVYEDSEKGILDKALNVYRYSYKESSPVNSLIRYLKGEEGGNSGSYTRYWHGYLVLLKPLLCIFTYHQIRLLNIIVQLFLLFLLCREIINKIGGVYPIAFAF